MVKVAGVEEVALNARASDLRNFTPGGVVVCGFDGDAVASDDFSNGA